MKTPWIGYTLAIASALCLAGCEGDVDLAPAPPGEKYFRKSASTLMYSIEIEGHEYIIFEGFHKGGIVHSGSCSCRKGEKE